LLASYFSQGCCAAVVFAGMLGPVVCDRCWGVSVIALFLLGQAVL